MSGLRLKFQAVVDAGEGDVFLEAQCACGASMRQAHDARSLHGDDPTRWRDADAHATRLRAIAHALEVAGCAHAYHDARVVTPCLFRPSRANPDALREALIELRGVGGAEVWETIAARALIPIEWVDDDARRFTQDGAALSPWPDGVEAAAAVAADVEGVRRAEALSRELVSRMRAFGLPQPQRVAWRAVDPSFWRPRRGWYLTEALSRRPTTPAPGAAAPPWWDLARFDVEGADAWGSGALDGPNPFEPLAALWMLGYAVDHVTDEAVVLVTPAV